MTNDFETFLSLHSELQSFKNLKKKYLEKPYSPEEALKKHFSIPMKKLAEKNIWLPDMLKPLDEDTKAVLRLEGITDEYLEHIFLVTHTPDKEIPFEFDEYYNAPKTKGSHYISFNSKIKWLCLITIF